MNAYEYASLEIFKHINKQMKLKFGKLLKIFLLYFI